MPLKTHADETPPLNLTSMVDVLFCLILFFMAGSKFTEQERKIGLHVPSVTDRGALTSAPEKKVVNVERNGEIVMDKQSLTLAQLTQRLADARRQYEDTGVLVRGDSAGQFQRVAEVLNACKQAGISDLGIAVDVNNRERRAP